MTRVFGPAVATFLVLAVVGYLTIFLTGCTEPGDCSFAGELARDHGATIVLGGTVGALALSLLARLGGRHARRS